ncbi:hypothetical protein Ciccas_011731 [Cichlidogyrus casuarinus]|uniref:Neuropeptide Y receptor type 1 n=1 Tax=Cichlidogyrus casuarinus TaxID=1844966 RepID=A0ABD2PQE7_9PLAT
MQDDTKFKHVSDSVFLALQVVLTLCGVVIFLVALWGNILVLRMILQRQRASVTRNFLFNLSLTDVLSVITCLPITITQEIWALDFMVNPFSCKFNSFIQCVTVISTAFTHVVISIDRFALVFRPLRWRSVLNLKRGKMLIATVWFMGLAFATPFAVSNVYDDTKGTCVEIWGKEVATAFSYLLLTIQYIIPLLLITCSYLAIVNRVFSHRVPGEGDVCRDKRMARSKRKVSDEPIKETEFQLTTITSNHSFELPFHFSNAIKI